MDPDIYWRAVVEGYVQALWLQIKADMLGLLVERPVCSDVASLGVAMLYEHNIG